MNFAQASACTTFLLKAEQSQGEVTVTAYLFTYIFLEVWDCGNKIAKTDTHKRNILA